MGLFSFWTASTPKTITIEGYEIVEETGELISVPAGLTNYIFPKEIKKIAAGALNNAQNTAKTMDFSKTQIAPSDLEREFGAWYRYLSQIKVPNHFETINGVLLQSITESQPITINIPAELKSYNHVRDNPWGKIVCLPSGIQNVDDFSHNCCLEELAIPGTLRSKILPSIYQNNNLRKLIIGEGIEMISNSYHGLNSLEFVSIPSTLNEFCLNGFEIRGVEYPNGTYCATSSTNMIIIEKTFKEESFFGNAKIKFKIHRESPGDIKVRFNPNSVIINNYEISYNTLEANGEYEVDYVNKTIKPLKNGVRYQVSTPPESNIPLVTSGLELNLDVNSIYLEYLLIEMEKILREIWINSTNKLNYNSSRNLWNKLYQCGGEKFIEYTKRKKTPIKINELYSKIIETISDRGMEHENGTIKSYNQMESYHLTIQNAYTEVIVIDYILTQFVAILGKDKVIKYLNKIMQLKDEESEYIKINLENLPLQMLAYTPILTPATLRAVICYCGRKEVNDITISEYIENLEKRLQNKAISKKQ